jgi:GntR family uxuAB operon transcriptional repressor
MDQSVGKRSGATGVASALRRRVLDGEYAVNERLPPERALAEAFGVARGTVREALGQLAEEGLVDVRPGSGTYVTVRRQAGPSPVIEQTRPLELMDARFALEPHICRLAVLHARQHDLDAVDELLERMEASVDDPAGFAPLDTEFHRRLADLTGNSLLIWIVAQINAVRDHEQWARMRQLTLNPAIIVEYNAQHRQIVEAIRAREPERAAQLMKQHLETARLSLTRAAAT